jgi:hypothetical protein
MDTTPSTVLFHGLFELRTHAHEAPRLTSNAAAPRSIPDPQTGRLLKVASLELSDRSVCPSCAQLGAGGYVSFVSDLRLAFACPSCRKLVWIVGA